jgi:hypothetical protein
MLPMKYATYEVCYLWGVLRKMEARQRACYPRSAVFPDPNQKPGLRKRVRATVAASPSVSTRRTSRVVECGNS